ncbi:hypothetical protein A7U60_g7009 [Sanghuangporus baumii]|uniref:F-box domain-containing protein n=1 Tax=Sanghuangporus baumii TaxID=108892 RepID=A0A9Q5N0T8_SANBA|nr:hypothetical protein A7U60_g7009 [Sanghuangporus baumii]
MTLANGQLRSKSGYLPTEVLSTIFQECLELDKLDCTIPDPHQAPLVLTWVCRLWRSIALNTHRLWAGVMFIREASRVDDSTRLLELWMERSGALPFGVRFANIMREGELVLSLTGRLEENSPQTDGLKTFIDTLLKCRKRWRVLEIVLPEISLAAPLLQAITQDTQVLEYVCISLQYLDLNEEPSIYDFSGNRSLKSVRLITPLVLPLSSGNEAFINLTILELHFCASIQDVLTWIDMAPNLTHLLVRFFMTGARRVPPSARRDRPLPFLTSLELTCFAANPDADDPGLLLDMLELPELTELEIELSHLFDSLDWPHAKNLLVRSGASLLSLSISGTPMSDRDVVECLRLSPELESFKCEIMTDEILRALTPRLVSESGEAGSVPTLEERMATDSTTDGKSIDNDQTTNNPDSGSGDASKYIAMCPNFEFFEASDVDGCSLQVLYEMMSSRCDEVYQDIQGYVDMSSVWPTPQEFKTLQSIVLPCDPLYSTLSHPLILEGLERTMYF